MHTLAVQSKFCVYFLDDRIRLEFDNLRRFVANSVKCVIANGPKMSFSVAHKALFGKKGNFDPKKGLGTSEKALALFHDSTLFANPRKAPKIHNLFSLVNGRFSRHLFLSAVYFPLFLK